MPSGDYGPLVTVDSLKDFHRRRLQVLASSGADIIAIETIPSLQEAQVALLLLSFSFLLASQIPLEFHASH